MLLCSPLLNPSNNYQHLKMKTIRCAIVSGRRYDSRHVARCELNCYDSCSHISSRKPFLYSEIYLGGFSTKYCPFLTVDTFRRKKIGHRNVFMTDQYTTAEPSSCIYCNCTVTTACHNPLLIIISSRYIYPDIIQYDF